MRFLCTTFIAMSLLAGPVMAKPPLRDVAEIDGPIFNVALADVIRKKCDTISARKVTAVRFLLRLRQRALDLGYTSEEIEAYTDSDVEKQRMSVKGKRFFAQRGVDTSDPQSYCAVGLEEIQKSSLIGSLLKAK